MSQYDSAKQLIVQTAQELVHKGYLMATGGNVSVRIPGENAFAITPSNFDYIFRICYSHYNQIGATSKIGKRT